MDELDDYSLTLTHREVEMILTGLDSAERESWLGREAVADLMDKITQQTGVK